MSAVRPTGVKLIIAFGLFSIAFNIGFTLFVFQRGQLQGILYINLPLAAILAIELIGLWRMRRWGLWLAMALGAIGLVLGSYSLVFFLKQLHFFMRPPMFWMLLNLLIFTVTVPIQLIASSLILIYLYKRRTMFR